MAPLPDPSIPSACRLYSCPDIPRSISDDPRIQALLESNIPPQEAERVSLLATASESSNLLLILKEKIDHAQQTLNTLLDGQAKVTENQRAAKTLLHPIRSIPDDVLSHIFVFCVHEVYDLVKGLRTPNSLDSHHPPWTLSQVCRSWRRVSLSTASLWRCLSIDFDRYPKLKDIHLHQFMLGLHLRRARQDQLTIRLSNVRDISSHAFIPILLASMPYWKHLYIRIPATSLVALSPYGSYLESLRYLDINLLKSHSGLSTDIHTFEMAQSLRILKIESTLCPHICLPDGRHGLTDLRIDIHGPFVKHVFPFLRKTPNIKRLYLHFWASKPFERLDSRIMMPKLTDLEISEWAGTAPCSIAHLFESLELPALSSLCFYMNNEERDNTILIFPEILPHHHCRGIIHFTVTARWGELGNASMIEVLTHIANMQHLTVSAKIVDRELLSALTRSGNDDGILPRLRTFDLRGSGTIPEARLLLEMVESRMMGQTGDGGQQEGAIELKMLEEVYLDKPLTFDDPSLASRWQALQSNGLVVYD